MVAATSRPVRSAVAQDAGPESDGTPTSPEATSISAETISALLREIGARRRVNVLFPNPQSMFDGLQVGLVNLSSGNLTFRRRDLVVWGRELIRFARVYDSRIVESADFGPGWRLALASELLPTADGLVYVDGSGARYEFRRVPDGSYAGTMPDHDGVGIAISGNEATWTRDGEVTRRYYRRTSDAPFQIASRLFDDGAFLQYEYEDGALKALRDERGSAIRIERDDHGRITRATDRDGRAVSYVYDAKGRLGTVRDVAGNDWEYHYGEIGRLTASTGPNGKLVLRAKYDDGGRVVESQTGRTFFFSYAPRKTVVTDDGGQTHAFEHNAEGATVGLESSGGISWRIAFDKQRRVHQLIRTDGSFSFVYGSSGYVSRIVESFPDQAHYLAGEFDHDTEGHLVAREFEYDAEGRLVSSSSYGGTMYTFVDYADRFVNISHSNGRRFEYGYSERGNVFYVGDGEDTAISADYDNAGAPIALHSSADSVQIDRNSAGRIVSVRYANGTINRYTYDELGNRRLVEYDNGAFVRYLYDASGNIRKVQVHNRDGSSDQTLVEVGDLNRIERIVYPNFSQSVDITYGPSGRVTMFDFGSERAILMYSERGIAQSFVLEPTGQVIKIDQDAQDANERDRALFNSRLAVLARDSHGSSQPDYGVLTFDELTFDTIVLDPLEIGVPKLVYAESLLRVSSTLLQKRDTLAAMSQFEKPSNPIFQSNEYRSVNCCIPCFSCGCFDYTDCGCQATVVCPDLTNFREVSYDSSNGVLTFYYTWGSATGNLDDISSCRIREFVIYHGSAPRFRFPDPPWNQATPNPTTVTGSASFGRFSDTHYPGTFGRRLANASVTSTQRYEYRCPCATNNEWVTLQNHRIERRVERKGNGQYKYTITKAGRSATIDPIPIY